MTLPGSDTL